MSPFYRGQHGRPAQRSRLVAARAVAAVAVLLVTAVASTGGPAGAPGAAPAPSALAQGNAAPGTATTATTATKATKATLESSRPVRLQIPAIGVDSAPMDLGLQDDGTIEVPPDGFPAGWYTGAPTPGELGPAVMAGHVDWDGKAGVFFDLRELEPDDEVLVSREDGSTAAFRVTRIEQFPKDAFPTDQVYGDIDHAGLRLITCGGSFDRQARSYVDNLVVFAELVGSRAA